MNNIKLQDIPKHKAAFMIGMCYLALYNFSKMLKQTTHTINTFVEAIRNDNGS